jgi:hypothetical protein|tara:strand:+ start:26 stop:259 length:234 start_codon:yes stop_codon:yes gene_type:complete
MFLLKLSLILFFLTYLNTNGFCSPRENWNYGKKNKEIKHHTETIKVRDLTKNKKIDNQTINSKEDKVYKPGTPRDKY